MKHKQYWSISVGDYHAFKDAAFYYKAAGLNVKFEEVGCDGGQYKAVFWVGKKPTEYIEQRKKYYDSLNEY